jgi:hypothetical protein
VIRGRQNASTERCPSGGSPSWQGFVEASIGFGIGHGPVDAEIVPHACVPGEGFAPVMSSAERIHVAAGRRAAGDRLVMIKVTTLGGYGAGRESAGSGSYLDRLR